MRSTGGAHARIGGAAHMTPNEMMTRQRLSPLLGTLDSTQMAMTATSTGTVARITWRDGSAAAGVTVRRLPLLL